MLTAARIALLHHPKPQNRKTAEGEPKSSQNPTAAAQLHQKTNKRSTNSTHLIHWLRIGQQRIHLRVVLFGPG